MELINPRTFLVVANLAGFMCALVLWVQARSFPDDIEGLHDWAKGIVLMGSAFGLVSLRGLIDDSLTILLASAALLLGQLYLIVGLQRFTGNRVRWRPALDAIGALLLLVAWLTYGSYSYQGRLFLLNLANLAFFALALRYVWSAEPRGFGRDFLLASFVVGAGVVLWRLTTLSADVGESDELFDRSLVQRVYLGVMSLGILGYSIGFILLSNERLRLELEFLATRDPMTGAFNRRAFFSRSEIEWARATRAGKPIAVIASDIDFFKKVNDTYGHHVGDLVIKDFSNRATAMLRIPDILARFGGEEFFILLPDTGLKDALQVAERIRHEIETRRDKALPPYAVSLGVAVWTGGAGSPVDLDALLNSADQALYKAKQGGRNRVEHA